MNLPSLFRRNNNDLFSSPFRQLQTDLEKFLGDVAGSEPQFLSKDFCPSCELTEEPNQYSMKIDIPGVKKEDVKIEVEGNYLTVSAERKAEKNTETKKSRYSEISYGSYERSFTLPPSVDADAIGAAFENGVLKLTMPKTKQANAKQIKVQ